MYLFFKKRWERERRYSYYVVIFHNGKKKNHIFSKNGATISLLRTTRKLGGKPNVWGSFLQFPPWHIFMYMSHQLLQLPVLFPSCDYAVRIINNDLFSSRKPNTKNIIEGNANIFHEGKKKKPLCVCKPAFVCLNSSCDLPLTSWLCKVCNNVNIIMLTSDRLSLSLLALIHQSFSRRTPYSAAKQEFSIGGWKLDVEWCFGYRRLSRW